MNENENETKAVAAKRPKLSHEVELDKNQPPIVGSSNEQPPLSQPKIFKLDIDCIDEIFEYLSSQDLVNFSWPVNFSNETIQMLKYAWKTIKLICVDIVESFPIVTNSIRCRHSIDL